MDHLNYNIKDEVKFKAKKKRSSNADLERVRRHMQAKRKRKKTKKPLPKKLIITCSVMLLSLLTLQIYQDNIFSFISKLNIKVSPIAKSVAQAKPATKKKEVSKAPTEVKKEEWTAEEIKIFKGLEARRKILDEKEKNLQALEAELQKQKVQLDAKLKEIRNIREEVSNALSIEVNKDEERVEKLVAVYSNMKPALAAKLIEEIDEKLAIEVLAKMKKNNAASILNFVEPEKARRLSEKYAGYLKR